MAVMWLPACEVAVWPIELVGEPRASIREGTAIPAARVRDPVATLGK